MNIAELSMAMSITIVLCAYGLGMLRKSLYQVSSTGDKIEVFLDAAAMELSVNPHIGGNIDISV